jgi:hypothetical protein
MVKIIMMPLHRGSAILWIKYLRMRSIIIALGNASKNLPPTAMNPPQMRR